MPHTNKEITHSTSLPTRDSPPVSPTQTGARRKPGRPPKLDASQSDQDKAELLLQSANLTKRPLTRSHKCAEELFIPLQHGTVPLEKQLNCANDALKDALQKKKRKEGKKLYRDAELDSETD